MCRMCAFVSTTEEKANFLSKYYNGKHIVRKSDKIGVVRLIFRQNNDFLCYFDFDFNFNLFQARYALKVYIFFLTF